MFSIEINALYFLNKRLCSETFFKIKNFCINFHFKRKNVGTVCIVYFELMYFMFNIFTTIKMNTVTKKM